MYDDKIPARCCHCAMIMPGTSDANHTLWSMCEDCRMWQYHLWGLEPPVLYRDDFLKGAIQLAIRDAL